MNFPDEGNDQPITEILATDIWFPPVEGLIVLWMYGFLPVGIFSCFVKNWTPSKRLTTCTTCIRFQFTLITWGSVRSEYKNQNFTTSTTFMQFSSSLTFLKAQNFIYFTSFTTFVSFHCTTDSQMICKVIPCDCRLCHINPIYVASLLYERPNGQLWLNVN